MGGPGRCTQFRQAPFLARHCTACSAMSNRGPGDRRRVPRLYADHLRLRNRDGLRNLEISDCFSKNFFGLGLRYRSAEIVAALAGPPQRLLMIWFILAGMAGCGARYDCLFAHSPGNRGRRGGGGRGGVFKAQLDEIERDVARGGVAEEAAGARAEAARRLMAVLKSPKTRGASARAQPPVAAVLIAIGPARDRLPALCLCRSAADPDEPIGEPKPHSSRTSVLERRSPGSRRIRSPTRQRQGLGGDRASLHAPRTL